MGLKFRKSIKLGKGLSVNLNKGSVGVSIGGKGAKYTVNSKGSHTASVGIPGTGLYYSETKGKKTKKESTKGNNKEYLLEWQNALLTEKVPKLIMTEAQLHKQTQNRVEGDLRIIGDCIKILDTTIQPEVFFSRLQLIEEKSHDMVMFEDYLSFAGAKPSDGLKEFEENKQESIKQFLIRYFSAVLDKAEAMKTDKAKLNQFQKFYDSLRVYYDVMDAENINYIETKYTAYAKE